MGYSTRKEALEPATVSDHRGVRDRALRLLAMRAHGVAELKQKLLAKGEPADEVQRVVAECLEQGFLNDTLFACHRTVSRIAGKGYGPHKVKGELLALGLDPEDVARGMARALSEIDLEAVVAKVLAKRCAEINREGVAAARQRARKKCIDLLYRRGFDRDTIYRILS